MKGSVTITGPLVVLAFDKIWTPMFKVHSASICSQDMLQSEAELRPKCDLPCSEYY